MIIQDIFPPEKIKKITKEKILGIRHYKNKKDKYFNISWRVLVAVIIFAAVFSLTGFPSKVFGEIGFFEEKIKLDITEIKLQSKYQQANIIKRNYKLQKASFIKEAKDKNSIQIEVGDKAKDKFTPEMTIRKWDDEVNLKVKYKHNIKEKNQTVDLEGDKIKWENHKTEVHYYEVKEGDVIVGDTTATADGYEVEVILLEKPGTNVVEFDIETKGLNFYYQPALNLEDNPEADYCMETQCFKDGEVVIERPENIVGSYAVYHESKAGNYEALEGKNYRAGKAFHIYRPKIIDDSGKEVWGKLNIDVENKLLTVEIPQEFLDNAVYPVIVDPNFGYETKGTAGQTVYPSGGTVIIGSWFTAPENGTVTSVTACTDCYNDHIYAIYKRSDNSLVAMTNNLYSVDCTKNDNDWHTSDLTTSPSITASEDYWFVLWDNGNYMFFKYDTVADKAKWHDNPSTVFPTPPDPWSPVDDGVDAHKDRIYSIYCTYTAAPTYHPRPAGVSPSGGGMMVF